MKRSSIILVLVASLFASCSYEKRLNKWCKRCPSSDSITEIKKDSIVYKDTTVYITQPGDTIRLSSPCDSSGKLKVFEIKKKKNGLVTTLKSDGKVITADCRADSLIKVIEQIRADHFASINSSKVHAIKLPCDNERTAFDRFTFWWFWITFCIIVIYWYLKRGRFLISCVLKGFR